MKSTSSSSSSLTPKKITISKQLHYVMSVLYTLVTGIIVAATIIGIEYETTFQSGVLILNAGITYAICCATIVGKRHAKTHHSEFIIYKDIATVIIMTSFISGVFTVYPIYDTISVLRRCNTDHTHQHPFSVQQLNDNPSLGSRLQLTGQFTYLDRASGQRRQNILNLVYDEHRGLRDIREKSGDEWKTIKLHSFDSSESQPLTSVMNRSQYKCLEREVRLIMAENEALTRSRIHTSSSAYDDPQGTKTSPEEDRIFLEQTVHRQCRNEYGFMIGWVMFLILLIILNTTSIIIYSWIGSLSSLLADT